MLPVATEADPTVHSYAGVTDPSSASEPVAEQLRVFPTTTPDEGDIAAVVIVGAVFSTETSTDELAVEPEESVAVAEQVIVEPTSVSEEETV